MYIHKKYSVKNMLMWTRWEILLFTMFAVVVTVLYELLGLKWLHLPWTPIALVGTAVAFLIGFQNNAAYDRLWEARKIWGGIVNASRTWAMQVMDMVTNEHAVEKRSEAELKEHHRVLIHRHIAWMTALRHAMRQKKTWETFSEHRTNREWEDWVTIPEREISVGDDLAPLLSAEEHKRVMSKTNKSAAILQLQSEHLRMLKEQGVVWEFSFLELESLLQEFFALQGKSERIKNFPYPRQFATIGYDFVRLFILLLPFGVVPEFASLGQNFADSFPLLSKYFVWVAVPFTVIVSWIFHTMQRIGIVGENPFEGSANDVPISTISRGIEIDLREMLNEDSDQIPEPLADMYGVQM